MTRKLWASLALIALATVASAGPRGTVPREDAGKYQAHAERDGLVIGAEVLTSDQAHKKFSANVNRCCIVVEVALYPAKDKPVDVLLDDFALRPAETDIAARPMSPQVVAARLDNKPEAQSRVSTTSSVGVGYESGTYIDPVTGRPVKYHGVDTEAGGGRWRRPFHHFLWHSRPQSRRRRNRTRGKGPARRPGIQNRRGLSLFPVVDPREEAKPARAYVQVQRPDRRFLFAVSLSALSALRCVQCLR